MHNAWAAGQTVSQMRTGGLNISKAKRLCTT